MKKLILAAIASGLLFSVSLANAAPPVDEQVQRDLDTALRTAARIARDRSKVKQFKQQQAGIAEALRKVRLQLLTLEKERAEFEEKLLQAENVKPIDEAAAAQHRPLLLAASEEIRKAAAKRDSLSALVSPPLQATPASVRIDQFQLYVLRRSIRNVASHFMSDADSDPTFLGGLMSLLTDRFGESGSDMRGSSELLAAAAARKWKMQADETIPAMLRRNREAFEATRSQTVIRFQEAREALADLETADERLSHQESELLWSDVLATTLRAMTLDDPAKLFREKAAQHPEQAAAYSIGYQAVLNARPALAMDTRLLLRIAAPQYPNDLKSAGDVAALLQTLTKRLAPNDPQFVELQARLIRWLNTDKSLGPLRSVNHQHQILGQLASLANALADDPARLAARQELFDTLLQRDYVAFDQMTVLMEMPAATRREWLMKRPIDVSFEATPAREALRQLSKQVRIPLWIDTEAAANVTPIRLKKSGAWSEILKSVLEQTDLASELVGGDVLWIGQPQMRARAEATLARSLSRLPPENDSKLALALRREMPVEFDDLTNVFAFFQSFFEVNTVSLTPSVLKAPITVRANLLPAHLALTLMTDQAGGAWLARNDVLALGSPKAIERFGTLANANGPRAVRLKAAADMGNHAAQVALKPVSFDFAETPLQDLLKYFRDHQEGAEFVLHAPDKDTPVTLSLKDVPFAWALDLILIDAGLTWDLRDELLFIGDAESVRLLREAQDAAGKPKK